MPDVKSSNQVRAKRFGGVGEAVSMPAITVAFVLKYLKQAVEAMQGLTQRGS